MIHQARSPACRMSCAMTVASAARCHSILCTTSADGVPHTIQGWYEVDYEP